jgi:hypothetical protein
MKKINTISQLLLERYHLGLVTDKERKIVETAIFTDNETYNRYEAIKKSDDEFRRLYPLDKLPRLAAVKDTVVPSRMRFGRRLRYKPLVMGICAAVVAIALFSVFYLLKSRNSNEDAVAQETEEIINEEIDNNDELVDTSSDFNYYTDDNIVEPKPKQEQKTIQKQEPKQQQKPAQEQKITQSQTENKNNPIIEKEGIPIASVPEPDTGIKTRGGNEGQQSNVTWPSEEEANITIPPGLTFIFENMFANKQLSVVVIPGRITSIGKNAFAGNPLVSVTLGANVTVADEAFPGNFKDVYNNHGRAAGTYIRPDVLNTAWAKK